MHKLGFVFLPLFLTISLYANIDSVQNINIENQQSDGLNTQESIETVQEPTFNEKSKKTVQKLLKTKKIPLFFVSRKTLKKYYKDFDYELIWVKEEGIKQIALDLLETIKNDPVLKPHSKKAFKLDRIIKSLNSLDKSPEKYLESMTKIDFMLTGIYNKYMRYLSRGFINWKSFKKQLKQLDEEKDINGGWEKYNVRKNIRKLLFNAVEENDLTIAFKEVDFTFPKAKDLANKISEFEEISLRGGYTKLPKSKTLKEGQKNPVIKILRERLTQSNDLVLNECAPEIKVQNLITNTTTVEEDLISEQISNTDATIITEGSDVIENNCYEVFDSTLKEAVISFQKSHGLKPDGVVGPMTRKHLNVSVEKKIIKMRLNLERMRWLPRTLGEKFILVNIPEYKMRMYEGDNVKLKMRIVVGTKKHPTPIFSNKMSFVVLNPYWKIPHSIVRKEIVPKLVDNPSYLDEKGINIHENWDYKSSTVESSSIDWSYYLGELNRLELQSKIKEPIIEEEILEKVEVPIYRFIQIPSEKNPLGRIKFMFPNKYSVYLHDSPAKQYFKYNKRAYSHGCVRLAEPKKLLETIASMDENVNYNEANEILQEIDKTQITLNKQIPVHLVYITSWIDENGKIQFRDDIYKYDKMQRKLLYKPNQYM